MTDLDCTAVLARECRGVVRHYDVTVYERGSWQRAKRRFCAACVAIADSYGMQPTPCRAGCGLRHERVAA